MSKRNYRHWTFKELQYLKESYRKKTIREIATDLNRSSGSVIGKVNDLGLSKSTEYAVYENQEVVAIGTMTELMDRFGLRRRTILNYAAPWYKRKLEKENKLHRRYVARL